MKTQPIAYGNIYWHISSLGISVLLVHISYMTFKSMLHDNHFTNYLSHSCTEYIEINILQCQIHQYIKKTNYHISPQLIEHGRNTTTFGVGNSGPGLGQ